MQGIRHVTIVLSIVLTVASPKWAFATSKIEQMCLAKKDYLAAASKTPISVDQTIRSVVKENNDVIFLGVEHGNFENLLYPNLVTLIKSVRPDLNCFFVEESLSEEDARVLSDFNDGNEGSEEKMKSRFEWYSNFFLFLKRNGLKIHYVDFPGKDSMPLKSREDTLRWLNARDEFMAKHIAEFKQSKKCKAAVFPIGASHLVKAKNRVDLKSRLVDQRISTSEILLLISGRNSATQSTDYQYALINAGLIWTFSPISDLTPSIDSLLCRANPKLSVVPYAFLNAPSKVPIAYMADIEEFLGTFGEFQGTIIYSCQTEKCNEENQSIEKSLRDQHVHFY